MLPVLVGFKGREGNRRGRRREGKGREERRKKGREEKREGGRKAGRHGRLKTEELRPKPRLVRYP